MLPKKEKSEKYSKAVNLSRPHCRSATLPKGEGKDTVSANLSDTPKKSPEPSSGEKDQGMYIRCISITFPFSVRMVVL